MVGLGTEVNLGRSYGAAAEVVNAAAATAPALRFGVAAVFAGGQGKSLRGGSAFSPCSPAVAHPHCTARTDRRLLPRNQSVERLTVGALAPLVEADPIMEATDNPVIAERASGTRLDPFAKALLKD